MTALSRVLPAGALLLCFTLSFAPCQAAPPPAQQQAIASEPPAAPEISAAEDKIEHQELAAAQALLEPYLSSHPGDARALFDLGYVNEADGHDDAAAAEYRLAIQADPARLDSRLALGLLLARQGKPGDAREQLRQAAALASSSEPNPQAGAEALRGLARLDVTTDPEAARKELLSALKVSPEEPEDLLLTAQIAEANGDLETAAEGYRRLLADPSGTESGLAAQAASGLAQILLQQRKFGDSEQVLRTALARTPDEPTLNAQLAAALIGQGKNEQALAPLEKVHEREPENSAVNQMLADAYAQSGYPEKADPIYAAMVEARPEDAALLGEQGKNLILEGQYEHAQAVLERAVKLNSGDGETWSELALAASQNKHYSRALEALSMRAKYLPETAASSFLKATVCDKLHDYKAAREAYRVFLAASAGQFPDLERQARGRLVALGRTR